MPGKANTYTLGEYGVNRVKSPVHLIDGELLTAQNAEIPFERGNRGLRKRSGMARINADALAGTVLSMSLIPFPDPTEDWLGGPGSASGFEVFVAGGGGTSRRTTDGTTFSNNNLAGLAGDLHNGQTFACYWYNGRLYYLGDTDGQILWYDGSDTGLEATLPATHPVSGTSLTSALGMCGLGNRLYVLALYDSPYYQVFVSTIDSNTVSTFCEGFKTTVGAETGFLLRRDLVGPVAFDGQIFVASRDHATTTGYVYRASKSASTWTEDRSTGSSRYTGTIGPVGTSLWMATLAAGTDYQLERRDVDGSYTVIRGPQASGLVGGAAYQDRVYLVTGNNLERSTDNGGSWSTIVTGTITSTTGIPGRITYFNGSYYVLLGSELIRDDGATGTEITVGGASYRSAFVRI